MIVSTGDQTAKPTERRRLNVSSVIILNSTIFEISSKTNGSNPNNLSAHFFSLTSILPWNMPVKPYEYWDGEIVCISAALERMVALLTLARGYQGSRQAVRTFSGDTQ